MMAWAQWMVPELSLSAQLEIEHGRRVLLEQVHTRPEDVAKVAGDILHQNAMLQSILRKAIKHIAELELAEVLAEPRTAQPPKC